MENDLDALIQRHKELHAMKESVVKFAKELERSEHEFMKRHFHMKDGDTVNTWELIKKAKQGRIIV